MTTAPHGLIGSRRAVGGEASTAVEETPAAAFCRRSPAVSSSRLVGFTASVSLWKAMQTISWQIRNAYVICDYLIRIILSRSMVDW